MVPKYSMRLAEALYALSETAGAESTGSSLAAIRTNEALTDNWAALFELLGSSSGEEFHGPGSRAEQGVPFDDFSNHAHGCACAGCQRQDLDAMLSNSGSIDVGNGTTLPLGSLSELADFLTTGFWQATNNVTRKFNLEASGPNPKNGVISYNISGFSDVSGYSDSNGLVAARRDLAREVFKLYSEVLGIAFVETTGAADIYFSDNQDGAYAFSTGWSTGIDYSVVNVAAGWHGGSSGYDSYTLQTLFHEVGHALGLGHQGVYNGSASFPGDAGFANDSWQATMMSYFSQTENTVVDADLEFLQTPMSVDWLALDALYDTQQANGTSFGSGNAFEGATIYGFGTNITSETSDIWARFSEYAHRTASTIIDAGGIDTLDVSGYAADQAIDLTVTRADDISPTASDIGGRTGNLTLAAGTVIENAKGGAGDDSFLGNDAANSFWGDAGNDQFTDTLGFDRYYGGAGVDTLLFAGNFAGYSVAYDAAVSFLEVIDLSINSVTAWVEDTVEWLSFSDTVFGFDDFLPPPVAPTLPTLQVTSILDNVGIIRGKITGGATDDTIPQITGTLSGELPEGATVMVYRDGALLGKARVDGTDWRYWDGGVPEGSYDYTSAVLYDGQTSNLSNALNITIDTTAPVVTVDAISTEDSTPRLMGDVAKDAVSVSIAVNGLTYEAGLSGARWFLPDNVVTELSHGEHSIVAKATDSAGNQSSAEGTVTILASEPESQTGTPIMAIGSIILPQAGANQWHSITFDEVITDAVVVGGGLTSNDADPAHVRIRNVTDTGFEIQIEEWDYLDGVHGAETVSWIAVSAGAHEIGGLAVEAGRTTARDESTYNVALSDGFDETPVVFAQVASNTDPSAVTTRLHSVGSDGFEFQMQEEEAADGTHGTEEIHWLAIQAGEGQYFDAGLTPNAVRDRTYDLAFDAPAPTDAVFVASMQGINGRDAADTRISEISSSGAILYIGEEQSKDSEVVHASETVGFLIGSDALLFA